MLAITEGDWWMAVMVVVGMLALLSLAHFLPKEDLGPDPDYPEEGR